MPKHTNCRTGRKQYNRSLVPSLTWRYDQELYAYPKHSAPIGLALRICIYIASLVSISYISRIISVRKAGQDDLSRTWSDISKLVLFLAMGLKVNR